MVAAVVVFVVCGGLRTPLQAQSPAGPTTSDVGTLSGKVVDAASGDPIIDAGVEVVQTGKRARTDLDGKFSLKLPPGTYELRFFAPLFTGSRVKNLVVKANATTTAEAKLEPEGAANVEVVEVTAKAKKAAESTQLMERKTATVVKDNIGAQTISKSPGSNAAEVVTRLPSVTVDKGKYVFVRGLSQRYSFALLNGSRLPSTDPNVRVVPLDLFPAKFIDALSVIKSYSADLPGDFSGGLVDVTLQEQPESLTYGIGANLGFNTNTTFQEFDSYQGSGTDYFGFGKDYRELPDVIPKNPATIRTSSAAQNRVYGESFRNIWSVEHPTAPPNFSLNFSVGNKWGPLGAALGATFGTKYLLQPNRADNVLVQFGCSTASACSDARPGQQFSGRVSTFETNLSAILTSGFKLDAANSFTLKALVNRNTDDRTAEQSGTDIQDAGLEARTTSFQYTEDQLGYGQLAGSHHWESFSVDWRSALSQTREDAPDSRFYRYTAQPGQPFQLEPAGFRGPTRTFLNLDEYLTDSAVDFTVPFKTALPFTDAWSGLPARLKFGPAYSYRDRTVDYRRYRFDASLGTSGVDMTAPVETILQPPNLGSIFRLADDTRECVADSPVNCDSFQASQEIAAFYGLVDLPILKDSLQLSAGLRTEYSYIRSESNVVTRLNDLDPIPGANLTWSPRDDTNLRLGISRTVSRPDFRELDPTLRIARPGELQVQGNPNLEQGTVTCYDLRWDWFFSPAEIASVSVFYKDLSQPIEDVVKSLSSISVATYKNAQDGYLYGAEFEARKNLGFAGQWLVKRGWLAAASVFDRLNFSANLSLIDSSVDVTPQPGQRDNPTNKKRSLQGQSPLTTNATLEYDFGDGGTARLLYTTAVRSIALAGYDQLPDIYDERRDQLDFVLTRRVAPFGVPLTAKFAVENILNDDYRRTQGDHLVTRYRNGLTFNLGLSYLY